MKQNINIRLKYSGADVDNGTMSLEDVVPALQGISGAYGKISLLQNLDYLHKLRITGVEKGSFDVLLEVWDQLGKNSGQLQALAVMGGGATYVVSKIIQLIKVTKHVKKEPYTEKFNNINNSIVITNSNNISIEVPTEVFTLFKNNTIASDLAKIVKPLEENRITEAEIIAESPELKMNAKISLYEKPYFDLEVVPITKTDKIWLVGKFNSLTKTTNRGFFHLTDGTRVTYRLASDKPENMYQHFIYNGSVKVLCIAQLDENLKPITIEIYDIQKLQQELFTTDTEESDEEK